MNRRITTAIIGTAAMAAIVVPALASIPDVNGMIAEITVRIDGYRRVGSGVIAYKKRNTYYVLTNTHVVNIPETYRIVTGNGTRYPVDSGDILYMPGVDLAVLPFTSNAEYRVAQLGDSDRLIEGEVIHVAGWPRSGGSLRQRIFIHTEGKLTQGGAALSYTNLVRAGMSGGPILDSQSRLIGINRLVRLEGDTDKIVASGVAINSFLNWWQTVPLGPEPTVPANANVTGPDWRTAGVDFALAQTIEGKNGSISSVAISSANAGQGQLVASGNSDGTISVWNLADGKLIATLRGHEKPVNAVVISPDGKMLVSGSDDNTIKIWNMSSWELERSLIGHALAVSALGIALDGQTLVSGSWDKTIKIWHLTTGELQETIAGHAALVSALTISPDGRILASGSQDKTIRLWHLQTAQPLGILRGHRLSVLSIAISTDGQTLASGGGDGTIGIWNLSKGERITTLRGHTDGVWSVKISPDGRTAISGSWDRSIKLWDLSNMRLKKTLEAHSGYINSVALSGDGLILVSGDWNSKINIWRRK
ncbi:MAG: trypsin-like peptidase domain-containing protein [Hormoscilla sp. SP12CHS1]|nr:trypsin-like peptidase domain-containing protein [Hormoscilla sp. SP12CHS1]